MTARAADRQHSRRHHPLAGCLLLSLLLHAALLARWNAPVTAAAPAGVSALRVTLDTTGSRAAAEQALTDQSDNRGQPRNSQKVEASGSNSKLTQDNVARNKFENFEAAPDSPIQKPHTHAEHGPKDSNPSLISADEENPAGIDPAIHLPNEEGDTAGAIAASVQLRLAQHFHYPPLAMRRGWQGQVLLAFRVGVDGDIEAVRVAQSSGHALLDRAALGALGKVHKVALQRGPLHAPLELRLPVIYRLEES